MVLILCFNEIAQKYAPIPKKSEGPKTRIPVKPQATSNVAAVKANKKKHAIKLKA